METARDEQNVYELFKISVLLKGLISVAEIAAGIAILFITPTLVLHLATLLTHGELAQEPFDFISRHILTAAQQYSTGTAKFLSIYLLSRGLIKTFLVWALLKNKIWAYPLSLGVLLLFVVYQITQFLTDHSIIVAAITIFDIIVIYFIWREYQIVKKHRADASLST